MVKMEKARWAVEMRIAERRKKKLMRTINKNNMKKMKKKKTPVAKSGCIAKEKVSIFIPGEIVSEILLRLPARSLGQFRCVSKSWLSITSNTAFVRAHAQRNRIIQQALVIGDARLPRQLLLAFPEPNSEPNSKIAIRLRKFGPVENMPKEGCVLASCDGLVCLSRCYGPPYQYHVVNPLTGQSTALPEDDVHLSCTIGFYLHRSTFKYRLIRLTKTMCESEVLVVGESSWRRIPGNVPPFFLLPEPLDLNGSIYWLANRQNELSDEAPPDTVVIFDEEQEVYSIISLPPLEMLHGIGGNLMDFNGELGLWVVGKDNTIDVWIMENSWIKRYSVNYAHSHDYTRELTSWWTVSGAVIIGDEEILVELSDECRPPHTNEDSHYFLRCNLKSGEGSVLRLRAELGMDVYPFPYTETLINPHYSAST